MQLAMVSDTEGLRETLTDPTQPASQPRPHSAHQPLREQGALVPKQKMNILMVDDQPAKLLSYEVMLRELDENLIKASSGKEALRVLLKTDVAVVLLDVSMPEIDGFELAQMIRQHPRFHKTAIIFVSAINLTDLDRLKGYALGAVDYISVPVVPELLRAKVSVFVELQRKAKQTEELNAQLRQMSGRMLTLQDEERRRVARDLHDSLGQDLVAIKMMFAQIVKERSAQLKDQLFNEGSAIVDHAIQQVRTISYLLHPHMLDESGLAAALQWYVEGVAKRSGINISLDVQPHNFPRLASDLEIAIFRIVQEALTNVFRHSGASRSWVILSHEENRIVVMVRDNGKGLAADIAELRSDRIGVGLGGMRERTREFRGEFRVSNAHPGTLVEIVIPMAGPSHEWRIPAQPADDRPPEENDTSRSVEPNQ
jgi:signal transduction histidine kinase